MSDKGVSTKHHDREVHAASAKKRSAEKKKARLERREAGTSLEPHTIANQRVFDHPRVDQESAEVAEELRKDEFTIINENEIPKILITASFKPCPRTHGFCKELAAMIPNSTFVYRHKLSVKELIRQAQDNNFTSVIIINEDNKMINGMKIYTLPEGPTAYFRLSNVKLRSESKTTKHSKEAEQINPQVATPKFSTMLGVRVARLLRNLFPADDAMDAKEHNRNVAFVNERDFIFFRHYRFKTKDDCKKANMSEIGPRFTMRLRYLHKGLLTTKDVEYEYMYDRKENISCRRQFVL